MRSAAEILGAGRVIASRPARATGAAPSLPPPPASLAAPSSAERGPTACIVTCHNYGHFLPECLDSLLRQTMPFAAILVVDDASTDDTPLICAEYASRGVRYMGGEWRDVCRARRAGVAALPRSRFLLFVDADNWLARDYHELLRQPMTEPRLGVAYGTIRPFSDGGFYPELARPFDYHALRRRNYIDTCSLIRTEAYVQAGGWESPGGLADWSLWLAITRAGWTMQCVPAAILHYRRHALSMSSRRLTSQMDETGHVQVMRRQHVVTIVTLFAGRDWMLDRYATMLQALDWPRESLRLVAIDNSRCPAFATRLAAALAATEIPHIIARSDRAAIAEQPAATVCDSVQLRSRHAYLINEHLAHLYACARELMPAATDLVWSLEDDIEPPHDALGHFCRGFLRHQDAGVLCGAVRNRFGNRLIAWAGRWTDHEQRDLSEHLSVAPPHGTFHPITGSGFMCTIFRREVWDRIAFRPSPFWNLRRPYYDWAAAHEVGRLGWKWLIAGSVRCRHWQADGTALDVLESPSASSPRFSPSPTGYGDYPA